MFSHKSRMLGVLPFIFIALIVVVQCAPAPSVAPTSAPAATTAAISAAATAAPTATAAPKRGGKITMAMWQSPVTLNFMLGSQTVMDEVLIFIVEGMTRVLPDGTRVSVLAKEVPTLQNGGVSADGKTITYKLKENVVWSDGQSFTCDDVKFTWQAWLTPGVGVTATTGYADVDTVECPDPLTAVVKYKNYYAPYLSLFNGLIPRSAGDPKDMKNWAYNRKPIGTGAFKVDEWVADDHVTLSRNEKYWDKGKPYLDQIVIRIVPSTDVALQLLASGEIDVMWKPTEDMIPQLEKMAGVKYTTPSRMGGERLFLNLAENKDGSDPTKPHAILGDLRVRQAIGYGINKQRIVTKLLFDKVPLGTSEVNVDPWNCTEIKPFAYDAEKAKKLLDEAGWVPGADGIRVAKGAKYAPDGTRLRLKYSTTSGDKLREQSQVLVVEDMKSIGVELFIENAPSSVVIGTWSGASPRKRGNFDIIMYTTNAGIDPHSQMVSLWASWQIPSEKNTGGTNYTRFSDPKADDLLNKAAGEIDMAKRKALYCQLAQMSNDQVNQVYLYQVSRIHAYRDRLQNWMGTGWDSLGWNAADWWVSK